MKYALNLSEQGRVLSVTAREFAPADAVVVEEIPEDNVINYIYREGKLVYSPLEERIVEERADRMDRLEAQLAYTAMMTDTLLEV